MNPPCPRRDLLRAAGLAALAVGTGAGLSACGTTPTKSTVGGGSSVTVAKADVPVGSAFIPATGRFVVAQPTAGEFKAFVKACPHAGCDVSKVAGAEIICECHGSTFSAQDGSLIQGPATRGLSAATVKEAGDNLEVSG